MRTFCRTMVLAVATASIGGCSIDVLGPWGPNGSYQLLTANGRYVPAVVFERYGDRPFSVTLVGGSLRLRSDDTFRLDLEYVEYDGRAETRYTQGISGEWSQDLDTIWLDYFDPDLDDWASLAASSRHNDLEVTIPGAVAGTTVRTVFER